jgi:16S rRNA (adenine1518-N6/adenine1519-N6)-dimethyltransferase
MKRHKLGQHYLVDEGVVMRMVESAGISRGDRVLEIGTGKGAITRLLADRGASLLAFEVDRENFDETSRVVEGKGVEIRLGDAFAEKPEFDVLVASLPYSESSSFIGWLCTLEFERAVVMLQDDFVMKIVAPPGNRDYKGVSALAQIAFDIKVLERVGSGAFSPRPKVGSVVVSIVPRRKLSEIEVARIVRLFTLRRRQVDSALAELGMKGSGHGLRRVYSLSPDEVFEICRE